MTLTDSTNTHQGRPPGVGVVKTFARRKPQDSDKHNAGHDPNSSWTSAAIVPTTPPDTHSSLASDSLRERDTTPLRGTASTHCATKLSLCLDSRPRWPGLHSVQRGGRGRRSSVLVPAAAARLAQAAVGSGLLGLAHHQALAAHQRARLAAQKRAHTVQAILQQLVAYFEEVDAFELVEESPDGKASPTLPITSTAAAAVHASRRSSRRCGGAVVRDLLGLMPACSSEASELTNCKGRDDEEAGAAAKTAAVGGCDKADVCSSPAVLLDEETGKEEQDEGEDQWTAVDTDDKAGGGEEQEGEEEEGEEDVDTTLAAFDLADALALGDLPLVEEEEEEEEEEGEEEQGAVGSCGGGGDGREAGQVGRKGAANVVGCSAGGEEDHGGGAGVGSGKAAVVVLSTRGRHSLPAPRMHGGAGGNARQRSSRGLSDVMQRMSLGGGGSEEGPGVSAAAAARRRASRRSSVLRPINEGLTLADASTTAADSGVPCEAGVLYEPAAAVTATSSLAATEAARRRNSLAAPHPPPSQQQQQQQSSCMPLTSHRASLPHRASLVALIEEEVVCADLGALMTAGTKAATASEVVTSGTSLPVESSAAGVVLESDVPQPPQVSGLAGLLRICGQDSEAGLPTMQALLAGLADLRRITKVGEGSFGEAYKHNKSVFKVIPIEGQQEVNGAPQKRADEVAAEALMALELTRLRGEEVSLGSRRNATSAAAIQANVTSGFVNTFKAAVCTGPYAPALIRAWKAWDLTHGSENDPVEGLSEPGQLFLVLAMEDCGKDLERARVDGFQQACSLLCQVVFTLAVAESGCEFEHRDLHWGNVLLRPTVERWVEGRLLGRPVRLAAHGVRAALIDFTASRLVAQDGLVAFCDLSQDPELFQGPARHIQFDTYRWMRQLTGDDWSSPCLATNSLWVGYLAETLAAEKGQPLTAAQKRELRAFRQRAVRCASCVDLLADPLLTPFWEEVVEEEIEEEMVEVDNEEVEMVGDGQEVGSVAASAAAAGGSGVAAKATSAAGNGRKVASKAKQVASGRPRAAAAGLAGPTLQQGDVSVGQGVLHECESQLVHDTQTASSDGGGGGGRARGSSRRRGGGRSKR